MREIKFRCWFIPKKAFINFNESFKKSGVKLLGFDDETPHVFELHGEKANDKNLLWSQYTGLKDKNGREIYEGDVLVATWFQLDPEDTSGSWEIKAAVKFVGGGFKVEPKLDWYGGWLDLVQLENIEVVGNIYENSELGRLMK